MSINKLKKILNTGELVKGIGLSQDINTLLELKRKYSIANIPMEKRADLIVSFNNIIDIIKHALQSEDE